MSIIMKKNKTNQSSAKRRQPVKQVEVNEAEELPDGPAKPDSLDDEDTGFGGWLKSAEGLDTMKLFVIANSIVLLTTVALPHIQTVYDIISEALYSPDGIDAFF